MPIKQTVPTNSGDYLQFGNATTPVAAQIGGYEDSTGNGHLELYTTASGTVTEQVRVTSAGNVGMGTTSPSSPFGYNKYFQITATYPAFIVDNGTKKWSVGNDGGLLKFTDETLSTTRMAIDSSGNVAIGTSTTSGGTFTVYSSSAVDQIKSNSATAAGTGWTHFNGTSSNNGVQNIKIYGNGNIQNANNSYGALSDIKLKENIVDASPKLDDLMQVRIVNFNLKGDYEQHKQIGVIAQELEQIFPGLVEESVDKDIDGNELGTTTKGVKYSVFIPMMIKAIQELSAKVTALEAQLGAK